jgi:hypothetical protein
LGELFICLFFFSPLSKQLQMNRIVTPEQKGSAQLARIFSSLTDFTDNPLPNHPSNQGLPPKINWASRPNVRRNTPRGALTSNSQHAETANEASGGRLVAVYVEANRLAELEEVLYQLDLPLLLAPCSQYEHQDHPHPAPQIIPERNEEQIEGDHTRDLDQLTESFSSLSTSNVFDKKASDLFPPRSVHPQNTLMGSPGKKRYYTITVGKCTGVFWDTW